MEPRFESTLVQDGTLGAEILVQIVKPGHISDYQKDEDPVFIHLAYFDIATQDDENFQLHLDDVSIKELRDLCDKLLTYFAEWEKFQADLVDAEE